MGAHLHQQAFLDYFLSTSTQEERKIKSRKEIENMKRTYGYVMP